MVSTKQQIEELWPLSANYEYAAQLGLGLRLHLPEVWREWGGEYPLAQAAGWAFLRYLEEAYPQELRSLLPQMIQAASGALQNELRAAVAAKDRDYTPGQNTSQKNGSEDFPWLWHPDLQGRSRNADTIHLWTERALGPGEASGAPGAEDHELVRVHEPSYLQGLWAQAEAGGATLTPETILLEEDEMRLRSAAGLALEGVRRAKEEGFLLMETRPGSHHAGRRSAGGTCFINNLAVAAAAALRERSINRVAIVDIDAHHGNGTESIFRNRADVYTISLHQESPWFPGTGDKNYRGEGRGWGYNLNLECSGREEWLRNWQKALGELASYRPHLLLLELSADAHQADPASDINLEDSDFWQIGADLRQLQTPLLAELGSSLSEGAWSGSLLGFLGGWSSIEQ